MIYVLSIWKDSFYDIYEVSNSTLQSIIDDLTNGGMENTISKEEKMVSILKNDFNTLYYYDLFDRNNRIKDILNRV
jgi:hypothetical protein